MLLDTPLCNHGWQAPNFSLNTPTGEPHTLQSSMGENGLLVAFICNHCPYVVAIIERLVADAAVLKTHGVNTLAVMANDYHAYPDDSPAKMLAFAEQFGFDFPYVVDETQEVAKAYGAVCTPDFFGLNAQGKLHYRGRLDDLGMGAAPETPRTAELLNAMVHIAQTGEGPTTQKPSMGCSIKWR